MYAMLCQKKGMGCLHLPNPKKRVDKVGPCVRVVVVAGTQSLYSKLELMFVEVQQGEFGVLVALNC